MSLSITQLGVLVFLVLCRKDLREYHRQETLHSFVFLISSAFHSLRDVLGSWQCIFSFSLWNHHLLLFSLIILIFHSILWYSVFFLSCDFLFLIRGVIEMLMRIPKWCFRFSLTRPFSGVYASHYIFKIVNSPYTIPQF